VARSLVHRFRRRTAPRGEGLRPAHFRAGRSASGGACTSARSASIACRTCTLNSSSVSVRSPAT